MRLTILLIVILMAGCTPNNVEVNNDLDKYFKENNVRGSFAMLSNNTGIVSVYNLERYRDSAFLPASTFKIVNSLIGLQTGVISSDSMLLAWDGQTRSMEDWNKDLTMYQAFRASAVPYFQEVARRIGKDTMQQWLDSLSYGSKKITTSVDSFWLDHSLTITPDEQLGLVKKLYFYQLPFHKINMEMVKRAMLFEDTPEYKLSYKTGWSDWDPERKKHIGWVIGWIEENRHPYFFVLNLESDQQQFDMAGVRMKLLKSILKDQGFMEGRK
jgi:beta-lactamase class D